MKMKLNEIINNYMNLTAIAKKKLPIKLSFAISKNMIALESDAKIIDAKRVELAKLYCTKDENGEPIVDADGNINIDKESKAKFESELNSYYDSETNEVITMIDEDEIYIKMEDERYDPLSPAEILALGFMMDSSKSKDK